MYTYTDTLDKVISWTEGFIDLAKFINLNMTPQYRDAAAALYKMINNFLQFNQTLLKWLFQFEQLDLREETKNEFLRFYNDYFLFRTGPEYHQLGMISSQAENAQAIFLGSPLRRLLARDKEKLRRAQRLFLHASDEDAKFAHIVYDDVFKEFEYTLKEIKNNYSTATSLQKSLQEKTDQYKDLILKQTDDLNKLLNDYQSLSGWIPPYD
jgi:hypothetical protein